ncbi:MAG TPA: NAD-binding protein [Acidimicrobiales bacterium]|nr:NAD-binding protein [Acidimicrobiales bacterium]
MGLAVAAIGVTIGIGSWGFASLNFKGVPSRLGLPLAIYRGIRLYTLDLGPAAGGAGAPRPNWQLWLAFALAAILVLRGAMLLWRERARRVVARRLLRGHVVICGGGVHGSRLAQELAEHHDVVLVDVDPASLGMTAPRGRHEWRVVGDCVREETLVAAGVPRANWIVAIPGHDFVSSQVVSAVRSLAKSGRVRDRAHVLAQVEDPTLARFLEQEEEVQEEVDEGERQSAVAPRVRVGAPMVSPFSANAIAAESLLDEAVVVGPGPTSELTALFDAGDGEATNLLLAGDHPVIDAVVLASLRRWRVLALEEVESAAPLRRPPLHVSVIGPGALARIEGFMSRWSPEPGLLYLEGRDVDGSLESLERSTDWLRKADRADHAIVACSEELDGVRLTLELSRALGGSVRMTRVTMKSQSALDTHLEERTLRSEELATTSVKPIAELACRPGIMGRLEGRERLREALEVEGARGAGAGAGAAGGAGAGAGTDAGVGGAGAVAGPTGASSSALSSQLYERAEDLGLRSDSAWRVRPCERAMLTALVEPVPLSALVRAGLKVELARPANLRLAAERLSAAGSPDSFAAWCEYARHVTLSSSPSDRQSLSTQSLDPEANLLLSLRKAVLDGSVGLGAVVGEDGAVSRREDVAASGQVGGAVAVSEGELRGEGEQGRGGGRDVGGELRGGQWGGEGGGERGGDWAHEWPGVKAARVAIIAGAAGSMKADAVPEVTKLLEVALSRYDGIVLSGGSAVGVPGIVGIVARKNGISGQLVGYTPPGRYDGQLYPVVRETPGVSEFSMREPLGMWADIIRSGTPLENVRVLVFPGGVIARNEILLARAMGARVAFVDPLGETASALDDLLPLGSEAVLELPADPMTVRAFLQWSALPLEIREDVARYLHNSYRRKWRGRKPAGDPALAPWDSLLPSLKESNLAQADDIPNKLALLGKKISKGGQPLQLNSQEQQLLAEAEHGRWDVERLAAGWQLGERQARRSLTPYLKPWAELDEETKAYDLQAVAAISPALAEVGWGAVSID